MFYLKFIGDFLVAHRSTAIILWGVSLLGVVLTLSFSQKIDHFTSGLRGHKVNPYFFAMIPSHENVSYVRRKIAMLPGVEKVKLLSEKKIKQEIQSTLKAYGAQEDTKELIVNYGGVEVILAVGLQTKSQELIRQYIKRIVESPDLLVGPVEQAQSMKRNKHPLALFLSQYAHLILLASFMIVYLLASHVMVKPLRKQSFLIETFQRRKNVFRTALYCMHLPMIISLIFFAFQELKPALAIIVITLSFVSLTALTNKRVIEC